MDFNAELARFKPDPALANWVTGAVQNLLDQTQKDAAESLRQITCRNTELHAAKAMIQALTLELGDGAQLGPQMIAQLSPEMKALVADAVINAIHPIYWIAAAMGLVAFVFSFLLDEVPLVSRMVPKGE